MNNIYDVDIKGMRKILKQFSATLYGRTVFFIAYFFPLLSGLAFVGFAIASFIIPETEIRAAFYTSLLIFIVSFLVGTAYFYREVREFANHKK